MHRSNLFKSEVCILRNGVEIGSFVINLVVCFIQGNYGVMSLDYKLHPWWSGHFFSPLMRLQSKAESLGIEPQKPASHLQIARRFAMRLWECCDDSDAVALMEDGRVGASHFLSFAAVIAIQIAKNNPEPNTSLEPKSGKPFAGVAGLILSEIDRTISRSPK